MSYEANTWFESQLLRMNCQVFLTGFNSGHLGGSGTAVMLADTTRRSEICHPACSSSSAQCLPGVTRLAISCQLYLLGCCRCVTAQIVIVCRVTLRKSERSRIVTASAGRSAKASHGQANVWITRPSVSGMIPSSITPLPFLEP